MNRLLVATHNIGKIKEIKLFLSDLNLEIISLSDLNITKVVEEKDDTFLSNSLLKSKEYHRLSGVITLAEDSGLEVKALNGRPGVLSARYGGKNLNDSDIVKQIKELLETRVRPSVAMDGGDIVYQKFEKGIVYLQMQGACSGCPSSAATLKTGIENMLKHYIPEVKEVRPVND